jgi:hypothetical protein
LAQLNAFYAGATDAAQKAYFFGKIQAILDGGAKTSDKKSKKPKKSQEKAESSDSDEADSDSDEDEKPAKVAAENMTRAQKLEIKKKDSDKIL